MLNTYIVDIYGEGKLLTSQEIKAKTYSSASSSRELQFWTDGGMVHRIMLSNQHTAIVTIAREQ